MGTEPWPSPFPFRAKRGLWVPQTWLRDKAGCVSKEEALALGGDEAGPPG